MIIGLLILVMIVLLTIAIFSLGHTLTPVSPEEPEPEEDINGYIYGDAIVEEVNILLMESFPVQVLVIARGYLPDGCTQIDDRYISFNEEENTFNLQITTKRPADAICTQAIVPFEESIYLDVYGLEKGAYVVNVNGIVEEFELDTDNIIRE